MADETPEIPEVPRQMTPAQIRMAKARAARREKISATERVSAPATEVDTEKAALIAKADQAEAETKALEEALKKSEEARIQEQKAREVAYTPPPAPALPRNMRIERSGNISAPMAVRWPQIRGGTCEFCGVLDPNVPAQYQYKLCPHFRGM